MSSISVAEQDKERFVALKPEDMTHKEFFAEILHTYEHAEETVTIDTDAIKDDVTEAVASNVELAAFRGVTEAIEEHSDTTK